MVTPTQNFRRKNQLGFDDFLRQQGWNLNPEKERIIPASPSPLENAAIAIAICAYPQTKNLSRGGKAHKYAQALMAYMFRVSQWIGETERLPSWVAEIKIERMWATLCTGHHNLLRSFVVRDLISAALITKMQSNTAAKDDLSTFAIGFSPDLKSIKIDIPLEETPNGYRLCGKTPPGGRASLRAAIGKHRDAFAEFIGISPRVEGPDEEYFYQNTLTRFVKPTLQSYHILQVVWEAANEYERESEERRLPIDQILMRKAVWANDIHLTAESHADWAIFYMREFGIPSCSCKLIHIGPPAPNS